MNFSVMAFRNYKFQIIKIGVFDFIDINLCKFFHWIFFIKWGIRIRCSINFRYNQMISSWRTQIWYYRVSLSMCPKSVSKNIKNCSLQDEKQNSFTGANIKFLGIPAWEWLHQVFNFNGDLKIIIIVSVLIGKFSER